MGIKCPDCGETRQKNHKRTWQQWQCHCCASWHDIKRGKRSIRVTSLVDLGKIDAACALLRSARRLLKEAGAKKTKGYVSRAIKSADSAQRHAAHGLRRHVEDVRASRFDYDA